MVSFSVTVVSAGLSPVVVHQKISSLCYSHLVLLLLSSLLFVKVEIPPTSFPAEIDLVAHSLRRCLPHHLLGQESICSDDSSSFNSESLAPTFSLTAST